MAGTPVEVTVLRLYCKSPGSSQLRKSAAAELAHLLDAGWQEKDRKNATDHVVVRLERPRPPVLALQGLSAPGGHPRPRR